MRKQLSLFEGQRIDFDRCVDLTIEAIERAGDFDNWVCAFSGGKDSTTVVTLLSSLIESGQIKAPKRFIVLYADTRMEMPPLWLAAESTMKALAARGVEVKSVMAPIEKRYLPYILGRGVPPPNNNTLRWCTRQIKLDPMQAELDATVTNLTGSTLLMTGVRIGESAARDARIVMSCSKNGAECGQGWYMQEISGSLTKLAPIVHWRVCTIWDWLKIFAPKRGWATSLLADVYGGDEAEEINARTGCICCPLASKDLALERIVRVPDWAYLSPLLGMRRIYERMREPQYRLRKHGETKADGSPSANQFRLGPLTIEARRMFATEITTIQDSINYAAEELKRPTVSLISDDEAAFIKSCWEDNVWPQRWDGTEPLGTVPYSETPTLFSETDFNS